MITTLSRAAAIACAVAVSLSAQSGQDRGGDRILMRFASFDPLASAPELPAWLRSTAQQTMRIVQFDGIPTEGGRAAITAAGGQILRYLPSNAYVVRLTQAQAERVRAAATVRWVGDYHPAFRVEPELIAANVFQQAGNIRYNIVVADKRADKPALMQKVQAIGGRVDNEQVGGLLLEVTLTGPQLLQAAGFDEVLWIDRWTPDAEDVDNARIQGGANYVEGLAGYSGAGLSAHIYEGIDASHPAFSGPVINVRSGGASSGHGTNTAGIVFGDGTGNPQFRGLAPDAGKFYTNYGSVQGSRWQVFSDLVNIHNVSHTTASWGGARTFFYTATSADSDDIVFDHDLAWTQSQSNAGNQDSRPEAWAKNVFSIGGVNHQNDSNPANDSWQNGGASIGPASDGRIKPTLCAYYDNIGTTSQGGGYTTTFGGTSGATPIVAGHNVLAIEMFTDEVIPGFGPFGNQLRVPGGTSHQNRPHFPTLKALQVVSASQYAFTSTSNDNRREHQGWGFPNLRTMWDMRAKTFIVDETDVVAQGATRSWPIAVTAGEPSLKACLNWSDPAANPASTLHLINNLSLRVTSPNGTIYWGNNNLEDGVWSVAGGSEDTINSIECVFVQNPMAGNWNVEVLATAIVQDSHTETPAVDADYGLVVTGGLGTQVQFAQFAAYGAGCSTSVAFPNPPCFAMNSPTPLLPTTATLESAHLISNSGTAVVSEFHYYTQSTGGNVIVPVAFYAGSQPLQAPLATTSMTVTNTLGYHTATFSPPVTVVGSFCIGLDLSGGNVQSGELAFGLANVVYTRPSPASAWTVNVQRNVWTITCAGTFQTPELSNTGMPIVGTTYNLDLAAAPATTFAVLVSGLSDAAWSGGSLPAPLPGAPGCDLLVAPTLLEAFVTSATGVASGPIVVPNAAGLIGTELFHQWVVLDGLANTLGLVTSNAGRARIGN